MKTRQHPLSGGSPGTRRDVTSVHFGDSDAGRKAYIQASLHADEVPPMLVAQHLRRRLEALEQQGRLRGEVVLVPAANPIGLSQRLLEQPVGRFELASGQNFNRHFANLFDDLKTALPALASADAAHAIGAARALLRQATARLTVATELQSLRQVLLALAIDADTVLDLHCDNEAVLHLYTTPRLWSQVQPLATQLGCHLALLADGSGDDPFDESCSLVWQRIGEHLAQHGAAPALAASVGDACVAATVELRGERDVGHDFARADAEAILRFLATRGHVVGSLADDTPGAVEAALRAMVHPLAGTMPVLAPAAGVIVYLRELGELVGRGDPIAEVVDPVTGATSVVSCPVDGLFFARDVRRFVAAGARIAKISGREALRSGKLMSA